jgi:hypothetical protein
MFGCGKPDIPVWRLLLTLSGIERMSAMDRKRTFTSGLKQWGKPDKCAYSPGLSGISGSIETILPS